MSASLYLTDKASTTCLRHLLHKGTGWAWMPEHESEFNVLKHIDISHSTTILWPIKRHETLHRCLQKMNWEQYSYSVKEPIDCQPHIHLGLCQLQENDMHRLKKRSLSWIMDVQDSMTCSMVRESLQKQIPDHWLKYLKRTWKYISKDITTTSEIAEVWYDPGLSIWTPLVMADMLSRTYYVTNSP